MKTTIAQLILTALLCVLLVAVLYENNRSHKLLLEQNTLLVQHAIIESEFQLLGGPCVTPEERSDDGKKQQKRDLVY